MFGDLRSGHSYSDVSWRTFQQVGYTVLRAEVMRYKEVIRATSVRGPHGAHSFLTVSIIYSWRISRDRVTIMEFHRTRYCTSLEVQDCLWTKRLGCTVDQYDSCNVWAS